MKKLDIFALSIASIGLLFCPGNRESLYEITDRLLQTALCSESDLQGLKRKIQVFLVSGTRTEELQNRFRTQLREISKKITEISTTKQMENAQKLAEEILSEVVLDEASEIAKKAKAFKDMRRCLHQANRRRSIKGIVECIARYKSDFSILQEICIPQNINPEDVPEILEQARHVVELLNPQNTFSL